MNILRIICSPKSANALSHRLSEFIIERLDKRIPDSKNTVTDIEASQLPHVDDGYAVALGGVDESVSTDSDSLTLSTQLIKQLREADIVVIATPMHNFTIPSSLKAWIDHVVRIGETFKATESGKHGTVSDKPVLIVVTSGGFFQGEKAGQQDFLTDYLKAVFATIGITSLKFFILQGTILGSDYIESELKQLSTDISNYLENA